MSNSIPCFLCGRLLDQRTDKNGKAYFVCDACGAQFFIRRKSGLENLDELVHVLRGRDLPFRAHTRTLFEIQGILAEVRGIKKELKSLDSIFSVLADDRDKKRTRKLLRERIKNLMSQLERLAHAQ